MKSLVLRGLVCATLMVFTLTAFGQTPTPKSSAPASSASADVPLAKIAIIDTSAFAEGVGELKGLYDKLYAEFSPRRTEIESMKATMDAKQKQLDDNGAKMTAPQIRKLQEEIDQLKREGTRKLEDYQTDLGKREEALTGPTYAKINDYLLKYTQDKGITLVWNYNKVLELGILLYVDPKADVTKDFIVAYNKANPAATAQNATTSPKKP